MALKEKRDSVAIPNQTVKRKRKLKDDLSRKSLKKSGNKIGKQGHFKTYVDRRKFLQKYISLLSQKSAYTIRNTI